LFQPKRVNNYATPLNIVDY